MRDSAIGGIKNDDEPQSRGQGEPSMQLSMLTLTASIVASCLFACTQPAPPPAPPLQPAGGPAPGILQVCTSGALNNVPFLAVPFEPKSNQTPQADTTSINTDVQSDLTAAFNAAAAFQQELCGLDVIFIDPTGCAPPTPPNSYDPNTCNLTPDQIADRSWGLRLFSSGTDFGRRYIALSLGLWNNKSGSLWSCQGSRTVCAPPFTTYQTALIRTLLSRLDTNAVNWKSQLPEFVSASPNTGVVTVLAALAHEFGHVHWYDAFVTVPGDQNANESNSCKGSKFYPPNSWSGRPPSNRWVTFGKTRDQTGNRKQALKPLIDDLHVGPPFAPAGDDLYKIFTNKNWIDALAVVSPDEDFVETQEFVVLMNASSPNNLQDLIIQIYGTQVYSPYDIVLDIQNKRELMR